MLTWLYDIRNWIAPHVEDIHGHTQPHHFRFTLDEVGIVVMHYKNWAKDAWSADGLKLLKVRRIAIT